MRGPKTFRSALIIAVAMGGCGFTPHADTLSGAANSTGTITGTAASTGTAATGGGAGRGGGSGLTCASVSQGAAAVPPDVLIVLDASGSMNDDVTNTACNGGCGAGSKWAQMVPAINQVVANTEMNVNWGLKFFADDAACTVGANAAVPIGPNRAAMIASAITGRTSGNGGVANGSRTPTRSGVTQGASYLAGVADMAKKYIVLATDGLPNCPASGNTGNDDSAGAVAAVQAAHDMGIPVFVVGIATAGTVTNGVNADQTLSMMATAGGLARNATPSYYSVASTADFVTALEALVGQTASCSFVIGPAPNDMTSDNYIDVFGDASPIPPDPNRVNGWDYSNAAHTAIEIYGPTCDAIMAGTIKKVTVTFRCIQG